MTKPIDRENKMEISITLDSIYGWAQAYKTVLIQTTEGLAEADAHCNNVKQKLLVLDHLLLFLLRESLVREQFNATTQEN